MRYLAVFLLFFIATPAFAFTYERQPSNFNIGQNITIQIQSNDWASDFWPPPFGDPQFIGVAFWNGQEGILFGDCVPFQNDLNYNQTAFVNYTGQVLSVDPFASDTLEGCQSVDYEYSGNSIEFDNNNVIFNIIIQNNTNQTWGSSNGFWGNSTPAQVSASVIDGAQVTGGSIWPLLIFLGVSLAFIIFLQVVVFTKRAIKPKTADFDEKKADELKSYYSKDGNAPKWLIEKIRGKKDT